MRRAAPSVPANQLQEALSGAAMRALRQEADAHEAVFVSTPRELEEAILQGRLHIVVTEHLDMTSMPLRDNSICPDGCAGPLPEIRETTSIRGACAGPPTELELAVLERTPDAVALLPFTDGQCLIMSHNDLFPSLSYRLWFDNLYLRAVFHNIPKTKRDDHFIGLAGMAPLKWPLTGRGARYVTRVTIQGDGLGPTMGIWADENVYAENCTFANLGGNGFVGCDLCSAAVISNNATVAVVNSTFLDPLPRNGSAYVRAWGGGRVLLSGCSFAPTPRLALAPFYAYDGAAIYSADADIEVRTDANGSLAAPLPPSAIPAAPRGSKAAFLQRDDPWFRSTRTQQQVTLPVQPAYPAPAGPVARLDFPQPAAAVGTQDRAPATLVDEDIGPDSGDGGGSDGGLPAGAIAAIVAGCLLLLLLIAAALLVTHRRRRIASKAAHGAADRAAAPAFGAAAHSPPLAAVLGPTSPWEKASIKSASSVGPPASLAPSHAGQPASGGGSIDRTASALRSHGVPLSVASEAIAESGSGIGTTAVASAAAPPPGGPTAAAQVAFLESQLDAIAPRHALLGRFRLLGASERRLGGTSVVAFATDVKGGLGYAMKFFAVRAAFDAEVALRNGGALGAVAPAVDAVYDPDATPDALTDRFGRALPPCIVMERGESLNEWSRRAKPDVFQAVAVMAHVAMRLRDMHQAGYVHRDVKPANIMLLPRENRWTVVDFGSAMPIGSDAPLRRGLPYTPPEVVGAAAGGATSATTDPAFDAWALGIVAFELLTGRHAFSIKQDGEDAVRAQLRGEAPMPWEGDGLRTETRRKLGIFREPVLALLRRDPRERASLRAFCDACNDIVTSSTTMVDPS